MIDDEDTQVMTPEEAAAWLKLKDLGHENPIGTLLRLREDGKIARRLVAGRVAFTLADLRAYVRGTVATGHARLLDRTTRRTRKPRHEDLRPPEQHDAGAGNGGVSPLDRGIPKTLRLVDGQ